MTAAATAATTVPASRRIDAAANCAEPDKVVADMTTGASEPIPEARASTPNEAAKRTMAGSSGAIARDPARISPRLRSHSCAARAGSGEPGEEADRAGPEAERRVVEPTDQARAVAVDQHLDQRAADAVRVGLVQPV